MFFLLRLLFSILLAVLNGFVLSKLWGWFVVTQFDLPSLGVVPAIGVGLAVSFLTHQVQNKSDEDSDERALRTIIESAVVAVFALIYGWVVFQFV